MKLATTKALAKELSKRTKNMRIDVVYLTSAQADYYVGFYCEDHREDYDWEKDKYRVYRVSYPDNYYAGDVYATTADLLRIAKHEVTGELTLDSFGAAFQDYYGI